MKRYTLAEAANALSLKPMSVLYYIQYSHTLPTRVDEQGNPYLLDEDLREYRQQHQQSGKRRGRANVKTLQPLAQEA